MLVLLILSYIGVNIWWLRADTRMPIFDPPWHFVSSLNIWEVLTHFSVAGLKYFVLCAFHPPLVGIVVRPFYFLFGTNLDAAVLGMNIIFLPILAIFVYKIIIFLANDRRLAFLGVLFLLCYPGIIITSRFYLYELPVTAMVTWAFYLLLRSEAFTDFKYTLFFFLVSIFGFFTKYSFLGFLGVPIVFTVFFIHTRKQLVNFLIGASIFLFFISFWYVITASEFWLNANYVVSRYTGSEYKTYISILFIVLAAFFWILRIKKPKSFDRKFLFFWGGILVLCITLFKFSAVATLAQQIFMHWPRYINNLAGFLGFFSFLVFLIFFFRARLSVMVKGIITLWAIIPIFIFDSSIERYLVPLLPAWVIVTVIGVGLLKGTHKNVVLSLISFNAVFLFILCTWNLNFIPKKILYLEKINISLFNASPGIESYGPPQPLKEQKDWRINEFFCALNDNHIGSGDIIWLLPQHVVYGTPVLGYYAAIKRCSVKFWALIFNIHASEPVAYMKEEKSVYFMDLQGYDFDDSLQYYKKPLSNIRKYIEENSESFKIIFKLQLPDNLLLVLYKRVQL